jgi:membrane protein DedA with SNARE-associated domain
MTGSEGHVFDLLREYFQRYGYWTIAFALLLENTGVPVPGETTLLFASVLAYSQHHLRLPIIIAVGIAAAMSGDNSGYAIGYFGGRRLVHRYLHFVHVGDQVAQRGEIFFARHGAAAIFWSRFVAGLRVVAGPLAGTLRMPWRKFFLFNFLGAAAWVTMVAGTGYFFGQHLHRLLRFIRQFDLAVLAIVLAAAAVRCWKRFQAHSVDGKTDIQIL